MSDYERLRTSFAAMSKEDMHELFEYRDGMLFHKKSKCKGKMKVGDRAGSPTSSGYRRLSINYAEVPEHRVIFLMHHGYVPKFIDHIDQNKSNNLIENLRDATQSQNQFNCKKSKANTSGCKNVSWNSRNQIWQIHIRCNFKKYVWYTKDFEFAEFLATEARELLHGKYACHV